MTLLEHSLSFLINTGIVVLAIFIILLLFFGFSQRNKTSNKSKIQIRKLNVFYEELKANLQAEILSKKALKGLEKATEKNKKADKKLEIPRKKVFLLSFNGDVKASQVESLREEITAILMVATQEDEVVLNLESPGGMVHGYGLAASQLQRLRAHNIPLTIAVDKVAASGGYMMACVADKIIAAPFAIIGSIGVVMQIPNFHKLLEKNNIEFEQLTAGEFKRTLTIFGKNTEKARQKVQYEIDETQLLFKRFIAQNRPIVAIDDVATGEHWFGQQALDLKLVDQIQTSDDYLLNLSKTADLYEIKQARKKSLMDRFTKSAAHAYDAMLNKIWQEQHTRY